MDHPQTYDYYSQHKCFVVVAENWFVKHCPFWCNQNWGGAQFVDLCRNSGDGMFGVIQRGFGASLLFNATNPYNFAAWRGCVD